jgi:hypothetical protein
MARFQSIRTNQYPFWKHAIAFLSEATVEMPMSSHNPPPPKYLRHSSPGEHIRAVPADPAELVERMPDISEPEDVYDVYKKPRPWQI